MSNPDHHNLGKLCLGMACNYRDRCKHAHASVQGNVQFFVPTATGEQCHNYIPYFKPWGEGKEGEQND